MQKSVTILSFVLVLQVLLIGYLHIRPTADRFDGDRSAPLLNLAFDDVVAVRIFDKSDRERALELRKSGEQWQLPGEFDFPADKRKVEDLRRSLLQAERGYPVGHTLLAARSFGLTDDTFEKRVEFELRDGETHSVLLGSSPMARRVYARLAAEEQSFSIEYGVHELADSTSQWIDTSYLRIPRSDIIGVVFSDVELRRRDGVFELLDLSENEELLVGEVDDFLTAFNNLTVVSVLPSDIVSSDQTDDLSLEIELADGSRETVLFYQLAEDTSAYAVRKTSEPHFVRISAVAFNALNKFRRNSFVRVVAGENPSNGDVGTEDDDTELEGTEEVLSNEW